MNNQLVPFEQQMTLANAIAKSGLFGIKTQDQAIVLMALCEAENLHPIKAVQDYHIINGRPALKADAMLVRFHAAGGKVEWKQYTDEAVTAVFSHSQGGTVEITWTFEQAKKIGLTGKDTWRQYPRAMLRARVISEGVRTVWPGANSGMYTVEEVQDFTEDTKPILPVKPQSLPQVRTLPKQLQNKIGVDSDDYRTIIDGIAFFELDKARALNCARVKYNVEGYGDLNPDQAADFVRLLSKMHEKQEAEKKAIEKDVEAFNPEITADDFLQFAADAKESAEHSEDSKTRKAELKKASEYEKKAKEMIGGSK